MVKGNIGIIGWRKTSPKLFIFNENATIIFFYDIVKLLSPPLKLLVNILIKNPNIFQYKLNHNSVYDSACPYHFLKVIINIRKKYRQRLDILGFLFKIQKGTLSYTISLAIYTMIVILSVWIFPLTYGNPFMGFYDNFLYQSRALYYNSHITPLPP